MAPLILLVDDDPDIRESLTDLLEYHGYRVDSVSTGAQAIEKAKVDRFSAVILDLGLPDADGIAVLRVLQERVPATPILILTGLDQRATALHNGAFAFLLKPWNREELLGVLSRAMATA